MSMRALKPDAAAILPGIWGWFRYAHLFPGEASGLLKSLELPLGTSSERQTAALAAEAEVWSE